MSVSRRIIRRLSGGLLAAALGFFLPACTNSGIIADYEKRILDLEQKVKECETRRMADRDRMAQYARKLQRPADLSAGSHTRAGGGGTFDAAKLFFPVEIQIDPLTGGSDFDDRPGDDGLTIYLRPIDQHGDAVKAPGTIEVEVLDLAARQHDVGRYRFEIDQLGELWIAKLMTDHYTLKCPWKGAPPQNSELTVRVSFEDYISGRVLTAQTVCNVRLPMR